MAGFGPPLPMFEGCANSRIRTSRTHTTGPMVGCATSRRRITNVAVRPQPISRMIKTALAAPLLRSSSAVGSVPTTSARHPVFLAEDPAGRLLGFSSLFLEPPELDLAFVADDAQGMGIGRLLVDHMIGQAREAGLAGVRVVSNPSAEGFYLRMGAERVGTVGPVAPKATWEWPDLWFTVG